MTQVRAGLGVVPRPRRSDHLRDGFLLFIRICVEGAFGIVLSAIGLIFDDPTCECSPAHGEIASLQGSARELFQGLQFVLFTRFARNPVLIFGEPRDAF